MITIEQTKQNGAESSKVINIEVRSDILTDNEPEVKFYFSPEKPFIEGNAYFKLVGKLSDFEELYKKAKQAVSLLEEKF